MENIGDIEFFKADFNESINHIKTKNADTLAYALGYITNNIPLCREFPTHLFSQTRIYAELLLDKDYVFDTSEKSDTKDVFALFSRCYEEDSFCYYKNEKFDDNPIRLSKYKDHEFFYPHKNLSRLTNGSCISRVFRAYLNNYIKNFKPQRLNPNKKIFIDISAYGDFFVKDKLFLSASESALFDFFCFLNIVEFWEGFSLIKNFNRIKKPLIITDFFERIDKSIPKSHIIKRLDSLERQIFILES